MPSGRLLRKLIEIGASGDVSAFKEVSQKVIQEERLKQHHLLANDLERILYGETRAVSAASLKHLLTDIPIDKERGIPLLEIRHSRRSMEEIVLSEHSCRALEEIIQEHRRSDVLLSYGMRPSNKVLFYGPPGCGKTFAAEIIAEELNLPFAIVRFDALVSSYLGETASNLRKIFDYISNVPLVALFDEFDAIGKERDVGYEHGEIRRVVNAVLQMMDAYQGKSLLLAATNHEQILDSAIWRRFDEIVEFPMLPEKLLPKLLQLKLRGVRQQFESDSREVLDLFKGLSPSDIERIIRRAIKRMILKNGEFLTLNELIQAKQREHDIRKA